MPDIQWTKNKGRNGWDHPLEVGPDGSVEARNVHYYNGGIGTKRGGSTAITEAGGAGNSGHNAMFEYVPGQDPTAAELFIVDASATKKILRGNAGGSSTSITLTNLTLKDNVASEAQNVSAAVLNGKLYLAYDTTVNRLHVFDPGLSTTDVRRAGMGTPAAATVANTGAGTYAATLRYYKVAYTEQRSSVTVRRSELSPVVSFTPSGAGTAARVTKPAAISEGETHWELYGSSDNGTFYLVATTVVGTTTYDDSTTPSTYANNTAEPTVGSNTPFPSVKYLATDGNRLLGLGVWESAAGDSLAPKNGRVYFGPVLDSSSVHDDERINNTTSLQGFIDLARNTGSVDRGLAKKPINNVVYAFQSDAHYGLIPTENATTPYRRVTYSGIGALNHKSIVIAETKTGASAVYFLDPIKGPYTQGGKYGLAWCGKDVKDVWDTVNKDATSMPAFGLWYPDRNMVLFFVATGSSNTPDTILALDVTEQHLDDEGDLRGGWSVWTGTFAAATCGVMFSSTVATTRSSNRLPYVGLTSGTTLLRYDEAVTSDNTTPFQAYVTSGVLGQSTKAIALNRAYLRASAQSGVTIQQSLIRNFGDETNRTSTVSLTAVGSQTAVLRKFEDAALQDGDALQVTLGDASATASAWQLYTWDAELSIGAPL